MVHPSRASRVPRRVAASWDARSHCSLEAQYTQARMAFPRSKCKFYGVWQSINGIPTNPLLRFGVRDRHDLSKNDPAKKMAYGVSWHGNQARRARGRGSDF